jgi:phosphocarrier protein HPr
MIKKNLTITNPKGIHARPSALLVQCAGKYQSTITMINRGVTANAKNIMEIISLGARFQDQLEVSCDGPDEAQAMAEIEGIFALNFNDND